MQAHRTLTFFVFVFWQLGAVIGPRACAEENATTLHAILRSPASLQAKGIACKQLAVHGTRESVQILAPLLVDPALGYHARFALEALPYPQATAAFRESLPLLNGNLRLGVIHSLARRRDAESIAALQELLSETDPATANAAAAALGSIGTPEAAESLHLRLRRLAPAESATALGEACLTCADVLSADGHPLLAQALLASIRTAPLPLHQRLAASHTALLNADDKHALLQELLQSSEAAFYEVALQATHQLPAASATTALLAVPEQPSVARQSQWLTTLAALGQATALPALRAAAQGRNPQLVRAALRGLQEVGTADDVPLLIAASTGGVKATAEVARKTLASLRSNGVDEAILRQYADSSGEPRILLTGLIAERRVHDAVPDLWRDAHGNDVLLRKAAILALGETIPPEDLSRLAALPLESPQGATRELAMRALTTACLRMPEREQTIQAVNQILAPGGAEFAAARYNLFRSVGGNHALILTVQGAQSASDTHQDAATRALGEWLTADVAPPLLDLAEKLQNRKYSIRALRGYIRVIRQFGLTVDQRIAMSRRAFAVAARTEEQILILHALLRFPSTASLTLALEYVGEEPLQTTAAQVAIWIAPQLPPEETAGVTAAMRTILTANVNENLAKQARDLLESWARPVEAGGGP